MLTDTKILAVLVAIKNGMSSYNAICAEAARASGDFGDEKVTRHRIGQAKEARWVIQLPDARGKATLTLTPLGRQILTDGIRALSEFVQENTWVRYEP